MMLDFSLKINFEKAGYWVTDLNLLYPPKNPFAISIWANETAYSLKSSFSGFINSSYISLFKCK